jgi:hypothetical protein
MLTAVPALVLSAGLALLGGVDAAAASQVRYTLTITVGNSRERHLQEQHGSLFGGPNKDWYVRREDISSTASYSARSVSPFALKRSGLAGRPFFEFKAAVKGNGSAAETYSSSLIGANVHGWPHSCAHQGRGWSDPGAAVSGTIAMSGTNPARVTVEVGSTRAQDYSSTREGSCSTGGPDPETASSPPETQRGQAFGRARVLTRRFDLRRAFGHAFTLSHPTSDKPSSSERVAGRITLRFSPVAEPKPERQRWQVDVRGTDKWRWGVLAGLRAGVNVDWLHRSVLAVEDGTVVSARGQVSIQDVWPYSEPLGVFTVTPVKKQTWPEYALPSATKAKASRRVTLVTYDRRIHSSSEYLLRYAIRLAGPQAAEIMRQAGLPDPEQLYANLVARGPVIDSVAPFVPDPARIVFLLREGPPQKRSSQLPDEPAKCPQGVTGQSCFLNRGGQIVTVTRLR